MHFTKKTIEEKRSDLIINLKSQKLLRFPGAYNPLCAKLISEIGFDGVYVSGGVMSNDLGLPDIGLTTLEQVSYRSGQISRVTDLPTIVDIDTGWGESDQIAETIIEMGKAGCAAVHIEDQVFDKRCGHRPNKQLVSIEEMRSRLKIAINSKAIVEPEIINTLAKNFGSQAIVASIQAKRLNGLKWFAYYDNGREQSERNVIDWAKEVEDRGAGEILITSVDKEGTKKGYDMELCQTINSICEIPVIYSGGMKSKSDLEQFKEFSECDAVAVASILHYNETSISEIKKFAKNINFNVRIL